MRNKLARGVKNGIFSSLILSLLGSIGIAYVSNISTAQYTPSNLFIVFILWCTLFLTATRLDFLSYEKKIIIFSAIFSLFLSAISTIGGQLEASGIIFWTIKTVIKIVMLSCAIFILALPVTGYIVKNKIKGDFKITKKHRIIAFCIILGVNLAYWLALYPGIYGWDSAMMVHRAINNSTTSHYSVLLGELLGLIFRVSDFLFHNYTAGLAFAMLVQAIFMSYVYYRVVLLITKISKKFSSYIIGICFFTLNPFMPAMTVYSTQDVLFGAFFTLVFIELYNLSIKKDYWENKKSALYFITIAILMCLCRNNGIYALILSAIAIAIFSAKKIRKKNLVVATIPILVCLIITGPIYDVIGIKKPSTIRETLSVPSQQLARVYTINNNLLTEDEKEQIEEFYSINDNYKKYPTMPMKADYAKSSLNSELVKKNPVKYFGLWAKIGIKHPKAYIEAFFVNSLGTWYPNKYYNDDRANIPYLEYGMNTLWSEREECKYLRIDRKSKIPFIEDDIEVMIKENAWQTIPIFSTFCSIGFYFVLLVYVLCVSMLKKQWKILIPYSIVIGLYATIIMAPVSIFRYCYPAITVAPIILYAILSLKSSHVE